MLVDPREAWFDWKGRDTWGPHELVVQMDRWLGELLTDNADGTRAEKLLRDKPSGLEDRCTAGSGEEIVEPATYAEHGRCNLLYPSQSNPRIAAGEPLADDILKCALKPIDASEYSHALTAAQLRRLQVLFPEGVCDWSRVGVGQQQN
jgi:hypothetical protein